MAAAVVSLLSDTALKNISSAKIFERGVTYARSGAVRVLGEQNDPVAEIHAEVDGTETYTTRVWIEDNELEGDCNCMHANEGWFCKHQVAVALIWRQRLSGEEPAIDEAARNKVQASAKRAQTVRDKRQQLHEFLRGQPAAALAEKLIALADRDRDVERELQLWCKTSQPSTRPEEIKSLVTEILSVGRQFLSVFEVTAWVRRAEAVLPLLRTALTSDPQSAVGLCLHALRRGWGAMQQADDSNGEIGGLCEDIAREWLVALQAAGAQPAAFGDTYLRMQLEDPFGSFDTQIAEAAMGVAALNRYRTILARQWREAKDTVLARNAERAAKPGKRPGLIGWSHRDEIDSQLRTLERLHLEQLQQVGDVEGALVVLREDLSEPENYNQVTRFLEAHNRHREALANAEMAYKRFPGDWRVQEQLLTIYERDGWVEEAYALRRKQFDEHPDLARYRAVLKAAKAAKMDVAKQREAILEQLAASELESMNAPIKQSRMSGVTSFRLREVSLRAQILCAEQRWDEALALVQPPAVCNVHVLQELALQLDKPRYEQAIALLMRIFDAGMPRAQNPYRSELQLVGHIAERMDATRRQRWLDQLRVQYKAKRNFVRDLPGAGR